MTLQAKQSMMITWRRERTSVRTFQLNCHRCSVHSQLCLASLLLGFLTVFQRSLQSSTSSKASIPRKWNTSLRLTDGTMLRT